MTMTSVHTTGAMAAADMLDAATPEPMTAEAALDELTEYLARWLPREEYRAGTALVLTVRRRVEELEAALERALDELGP